MKTWTTPELNILDIKMSENIAASGDEDRPRANKIIKLHGSNAASDDVTKNVSYYTDTMTVINTSIPAGGSRYEDLSKTASQISVVIHDAGCENFN